MKTKSQLNRKVQLASAAAIITMFAVSTICYRGLVASVKSNQWVRHSCEALCRGMLEAAPHGTDAEVQTHSGWRASMDGDCSGGDR